MNIRIGELARIAGCRPVTIRFYEKEGLLASSSRTHSNYRLYGNADLERLRFILHCRKHDIAIKEIRQLLYLKDHPETGCAFVHDVIERHLKHVEDQLRSLQQLKSELQDLLGASSCEKKGHCAILGQLEAPDNCDYCEEVSRTLLR